MKTIGLIYGSDTGMTEEVTNAIIEKWTLCDIDVFEASHVKNSDIEGFDVLFLGLSTWYDGDLQSDWDNYYRKFENVDFTNKTIALYGLGDQYGYGEYFIDGVGILAEIVIKNGGEIVGKWPTEGYDYEISKAEIDGENLFYGLAIDEDNQPELTEERIDTWLGMLENQLN